MPVCNFWMQGRCRYGDKCWNEHPKAGGGGYGGEYNSRPPQQSNRGGGGGKEYLVVPVFFCYTVASHGTIENGDLI
ncbi:unnamed protein product [Oncorhynchus mykiss]|uniref:Nucleoporin NUP42 n=1 Tax=Oncorhynchus mykiss TaxID=8022 RepID=A0A060YRW3_ONCMY|nr:unnamed protein product [Oncorhynchus mykiss]